MWKNNCLKLFSKISQQNNFRLQKLDVKIVIMIMPIMNKGKQGLLIRLQLCFILVLSAVTSGMKIDDNLDMIIFVPITICIRNIKVGKLPVYTQFEWFLLG